MIMKFIKENIDKKKNKIYRSCCFIKILIILITLILNSFVLIACEINFSIIKGEKETYIEGDELIIKVTVLLTHRNCPEGIESTKFETKGLIIRKTTKWKKVNTTIYTRKLKIEVTGKEGSEITITAIRECEKEGGKGKLVLRN
jgi:hypothetical protein